MCTAVCARCQAVLTACLGCTQGDGRMEVNALLAPQQRVAMREHFIRWCETARQEGQPAPSMLPLKPWLLFCHGAGLLTEAAGVVQQRLWFARLAQQPQAAAGGAPEASVSFQAWLQLLGMTALAVHADIAEEAAVLQLVSVASANICSTIPTSGCWRAALPAHPSTYLPASQPGRQPAL